jgi:hypothetical protein
MKRFLPLVAAVGFVLMPVQEAEAQVRFGPQVSYNSEIEEFGIGARLELSPATLPISLYGSADYVFLDDTFLDFAVGAKYALTLPGSPLAPYFGAGVTHQRWSLEVGGMDFDADDTGFHVAAGLGLGGVMPFGAFVEGRYLIMSDFENQFVINLGILF